MGAADLVPGVSGSTVALLYGLYERFLGELKKLADAFRSLLAGRWKGIPEKLKKLDWGFLLTLLGGAAVAIGALARVMNWLLENRPFDLAGTFFGLVCAGVLVAALSLGRWKALHAVLCAVTAVASGWLFGLSAGPVADPPLIAYFLVGALAVCAMILPGVSGSFVMLMLGMYGAVIRALDVLDWGTLAVLGSGIVLGAAVFSPLLATLLKRRHAPLMAVMIGLMLGTLRILWPWPGGVGIISADSSRATDGTGFAWPGLSEAVWPTIWGLLAFILATAAGTLGRRLSQSTRNATLETAKTL